VILLQFFLILTVKKFENWSAFGEVKEYKNCAKFLGHPIYHIGDCCQCLQFRTVWKSVF